MSDQWPAGNDDKPHEVLDIAPRRHLTRTAAIGIACLAGGVVIGAVGIAGAAGTRSQEVPVAAALAQAQTPSIPPTLAPAPAPDNDAERRSLEKGRKRLSKLGRGHGPLRMAGGALHGEFVVPKPDGGFETVHVQRGSVTAVSATSITVKSDDGFSKSYAVTAETLVNAARDGISTVAVNDVVHVHATGAGATPTAVAIIDVSKTRALKEKLRPKNRSTATPSATPAPGNA